MKILYIEDNPQNMRLVRKMLSVADYDMVEAIDGTSGVKIADIECPDLILMDINLPDIDGIEATRRIKANPKLKHIPVIALTANAMFGDRESSLDAGFNGYLAKPISMNELLNTIAHYFSKQRSNKEEEKPGSSPGEAKV